jgi:transposase InsO family protein
LLTVRGMSKPRVIVLSVVEQGLTASEAAGRFGVSRQWVHRLLCRYRDGGLQAVEARSHRPRSNPRQTPAELAERIVALRHRLSGDGLDAGPMSIAARLRTEGRPVPSTSTIRRILHAAGVVTPQPRKRPRSSYRRFQAAQPNECWQSDFTHWRLADGSDVEILNWLDDHSRMLLACTAHTRVTGTTVVASFLAAITAYDTPAATLTDNGCVYTARFTGGRNSFEYLLRELGITQRNGHPGHPQTQGKIERFHQTLKRWLAAQPAAADLTDLQRQLDRFRQLYNTQRVHRAHGRTPADAYTATIKAIPPSGRLTADPYRVRVDTIDRHGKISLRRAGRMHHLGIGAAHAGTHALLLVHPTTVEVINPTTGEHLSSHTIDPHHSYWRNTQRNPGRWPAPHVVNHATHK